MYTGFMSFAYQLTIVISLAGLTASTAIAQVQGVPAPEASQAEVPEGYRVEVVHQGLTYPTSLEFDDAGTMYVAEAGYSYGDPAPVPRLLRTDKEGELQEISHDFVGPINDLLWHHGRLYISHRGKISVLEGDTVKDLVTGLPSGGDHHNNQMAAGPDGMIYFGQGTVTNSGVVGVDNAKMGWLSKHPQLHDVPPQALQISGQHFESENPLTEQKDDKATTLAFHAFGEDQGTEVPGALKASGTILRMAAGGSGLEVYAWGFRNPYGLIWTPDNVLYATENGFDVRGSRPIANDKEDVYVVAQDGWYGWPDFGSGTPITDPLFAPKDGPAPQFLMKEHPPVEKPFLSFPKHSAITKVDVDPGQGFGFDGQLFVAFFGHMAPMTGTVEEHAGHRVVRIDPATAKHEVFFTQKSHGHGSGSHTGESHEGGKTQNGGHGESGGHEEGASAGPRRLVDVRFSSDGKELYIVDFGVMTVDKEPKPLQGTGVIWKVSRK